MFNFGVKITSVATEHTVVIIDVGSRGLGTHLWTKAEINVKIMKRFWHWVKKEGASNKEVESKWRESHLWRECQRWAAT